MLQFQISKNENFSKNKVEKYLIESNYDYAKINTLFNNADTVSFIDLTLKKRWLKLVIMKHS